MKTDSFSDASAFLLGNTPDHDSLGALRWPWEYIFIAIVQGQCAVYQAGRSLGIDALRRRAAEP